jgi:energy-coupling factor transporter ATP-binding protein EcfA2
MSDATITTSELRKRYGTKDVVSDLSLCIGPGITGLLGPSGAGKTTLMRMLATVLAPTEGRLSLLGRDPADAGQRRPPSAMTPRRRPGERPRACIATSASPRPSSRRSRTATCSSRARPPWPQEAPRHERDPGPLRGRGRHGRRRRPVMSATRVLFAGAAAMAAGGAPS